MPISRATRQQKIPRLPFGSPHVFVLAVIDGEEPHLVHRIARSETVVGREEGVDFFLRDEEISKRHCLLRADGPICTLTDLGSLNGTRLNGRRLREGVAQRVRHLDQIQVGNTSLFLLSGKFRNLPRED